MRALIADLRLQRHEITHQIGQLLRGQLAANDARRLVDECQSLMSPRAIERSCSFESRNCTVNVS